MKTEKERPHPMENHRQARKHQGPQPVERPLKFKDKARKTKEPHSFEDHGKPKKRTRAQTHGRFNEINVWEGRDQAGERDQRENKNARSTRKEQSKTPKRRNDVGDLGGCCFMYEKWSSRHWRLSDFYRSDASHYKTFPKQESMPEGESAKLNESQGTLAF